VNFRVLFLAAMILLVVGLVYFNSDYLNSVGPALAMAIVVKDVTASAQKYAQRGAAAANDYKTGVMNAGQHWHDATKASADNYGQGVQAAIADGRFAKGVDRAGAARYSDRASTKGAAAFPAGVQAGQGRWAQNVQPYLQVLSSASLPPRGPKGDPRNQLRSQMVADLLRKKKIAG
jgi:hypothetical protein